MSSATYVVGPLLALAWLSAVVHAILLYPHRARGITGLKLALGGILWFDRRNFEPQGWTLHRRFIASVGVFFVVILGTMIAMLATETMRQRAPSPPPTAVDADDPRAR